MLARKTEDEGALISWWEGDDPDDESQVVCAMNETVLVIGEDDAVVQTLGPGRHAVAVPEGAAVAFVTTTPTRIEAEGTMEDLDDADMTLDARVRVTDAARMIPLLDKLGDEESLEGWLGDELMLHAVAAAAEAGLDTAAMSNNPTLCDLTVARAREVLAPYGIEVQRIDSISVSEE